MANNKTSSEDRRAARLKWLETHEHPSVGYKHTEAAKAKMRHAANERWKKQSERARQSENQKKAIKRLGMEHFNPNFGGKTYERTEKHREITREISAKNWAEPGYRGYMSLQMSKKQRERYAHDPIYRAKNYEAAKKARSSEKFKEYNDSKKRAKEERIRREMAFKAEEAETKYASEKMAALQARKYKEATRVLADFGITPLPNQSIEYYDQVIDFVKNML